MKSAALFSNHKWVIYCIALLAGSAIGCIVPLASTHLSREGLSDAWVGLMSSAFFLFMALGSFYSERRMAGKDVSSGVMFGLLLTASCAVLFPFVHAKWLWFLLMSLMGIGISFNLVGVQTALHRLSTEDTRSMTSGLYSLCFALGFIVTSSLGPVLYTRIHWAAFSFGAACLALAALLVQLKLTGKLLIESYPRKALIAKIRVPLSGAFLYGFSETTVVALFPLFLLNQAFDVAHIGYALAVFVLGCVVGTVPVTYFADRFGRRRGLVYSVLISILSMIGIMVFDQFSIVLLFSFVAGFAVGPIYPLTLSLVPIGLMAKEISQGMAMFTFFYGLGSAAGPLLSSVAMSLFGSRHMFSLCLILSVLFLIQIWTTGKESRISVHSATR